MDQWGPWDWTGYACFFIAAFAIAADTAIAQSEYTRRYIPRFLNKGLIGFFPLILMLLGSGIFLGKLTYPGFFSNNSVILMQYKPGIKNRYSHETFRNERVVLDSSSFTDCRFINVTFVYNATGPVDMEHNLLEGYTIITTENPSVNRTIMMAKGLGMLSTLAAANLGPLVESPKPLTSINPQGANSPSQELPVPQVGMSPQKSP